MHVFIHSKTTRGFCPQICGDSFSLQPQVFSVPCETCFSKGTILHFTQRLIIFARSLWSPFNCHGDRVPKPKQSTQNKEKHFPSSLRLFTEFSGYLLNWCCTAMCFDHRSKQNEILHLLQTEADKNGFGLGLRLFLSFFHFE